MSSIWSVGRHAFGDEPALLRFLEFLGSRLVFLIDWNKARKALQTFVGKQEAVEILGWSSAHDCGHRAFLELGGADLVFEAIRRTAVGRIPYGTRLDAALGTAECAKFLHRVLRQTSEGLRAGRSQRLIRDEIQAELAQLFDTAEFAMLALLVRHLGVTRTLASAIAEGLAGEGAARSGAHQAGAPRQADGGEGRPAHRAGARDVRAHAGRRDAAPHGRRGRECHGCARRSRLPVEPRPSRRLGRRPWRPGRPGRYRAGQHQPARARHRGGVAPAPGQPPRFGRSRCRRSMP